MKSACGPDPFVTTFETRCSASVGFTIQEIISSSGRDIGQKPGEREGLAIVKEAVERHGAALHIESTFKGTTSSVRFQKHAG